MTILKSRKRGRPKLLPEDIMTKIIQTVKALRLKGAPVSSAAVITHPHKAINIILTVLTKL